jgi:hypothetical protein
MIRLVPFVILVLLVSGCGSSEPALVTVDTTAAAVVVPTTLDSAASSTVSESICDLYDIPVAVGVVAHSDLTEISGIAARSDGYWVHNDSGSESRLWALDSVGTVSGSIPIGVRNVDWEDMATGPGSGDGTFVYLADIGDNLNRRTSVAIHRLAEPTDLSVDADMIESLTVRYPGGSADAEAFMVDPITGDSFIVTKVSGAVLRVSVEAWSSASVEAQEVASIDLGPLGFATSGDISADGSVIAVRTYLDVWLWDRRPGETVADAMRGQPCRAPAAREPQGEAITFDGLAYVTVSEGSSVTISRTGS